MLEEGKIKLLLTPLSEITKEHYVEIDGIIEETWANQDSWYTLDFPKGVVNGGFAIKFEPQIKLQDFLLSKGYDIRGLIKQGYAIDKTKLK